MPATYNVSHSDTADSDIAIDDKTDTIYEFTNDPDKLKEYYRIRDFCFKETWGLEVFSGDEDDHDRAGYILVANQGNRIIGGARMVLATPDNPIVLPMEEDGFSLKECVPDYDLEQQVYGEVGRFSILPQFCGGNSLYMGLYLLAMAQHHTCRYLATVAPEVQAVKYVKTGKENGFHIGLFDFIEIPDRPYYNRIPMKLLIADLEGMPDMRYLLNHRH